MTRYLKSDFHLHTYHSDNRDCMTPAEYVGLARRFGYDVLGFCDHHHNLTQAAWAELRAEVQAETDAAPDLLLTTGYEATWMTGHLCVLGKQAFDGESIAACDHQMWSPANTRILAHPDNNICAWRLPLPVAVQGVEIINGGQDPYAIYAGSPCNGLATYQRYLLLNHRVAAIAQSDCHQRVVFGRAWTGIRVEDGAPLDWEVVQRALHAGHTFAAIGDLPIHVWTENGIGPGDGLDEPGVDSICWEVPSGAEVTIYIADRPVAYFAAQSKAGEKTSRHSYRLRHNGPHYLVVKRGLAWAVSSPIWVSNQAVNPAPLRTALTQHTVVQRMVDDVRRQLDWLCSLQVAPEQTPYPISYYVEWLQTLLPAAWSEADPAFSGPGDPVDWAVARLQAAQVMLTPILGDLCRTRYRRPEHRAGKPRVLVAPSSQLQTPPVSGSTYRGVVDLPREWNAVQLTSAEGVPIRTHASAIPGERDPLHGYRSREQMNELVIWLTRGEIHEYVLRNCQLSCEHEEVRLIVDLWPAALGYAPEPNLAAAQKLSTALADPTNSRFFVHLRMPRRFTLLFALDETLSATLSGTHLVLEAVPPTIKGKKENENSENEHTLHFYQEDALVHDPSADVLVVQIT